MKIRLIVLICGFCSAIVLTFLLTIYYYPPEKEIITIENDSYSAYQEGNNNKRELYEWEEIALANADKEYQRNSYDCTYFSKDLLKKLKKLDYRAKCATGDYIGDGIRYAHTGVVLEIPIESTTGFAIPPEEYSEYYKLEEVGPCR